jgi:peroxiredoxin (alkyl hydroperoxide reductase subunit C)
MLLFIPAAFSFICPTEVLAFHNCIDEFKERDCEIIFVSTDSKHCLWQWQHLPKSLGGLGGVRVILASDQNHQMSRDYGVLLEDKGMATRGMYIIDAEGIVQQVTINNIAVGRSVLEALRLVEAFKVAGEKGVLCPANRKTGEDTLEETYHDQEHDLVRQIANVQIKDLDNNTSQSFTLIMPKHIAAKAKMDSSGPAKSSPTVQVGPQRRLQPPTPRSAIPPDTMPTTASLLSSQIR